MSAYLVPAEMSEKLSEVKKSRFIARASYVTNRQDALLAVEQSKSDYPDARHHCWAYLLGNPACASSAAMNDAGEPHGTAGRPILNVIQHKGIGDVIVIVARYFGGIKLGAGGLARAYSGATEMVLSSLALLEQLPMVEVLVCCDYSQEQLLRHWASQHETKVGSLDYQQQVIIHLQVPETSYLELSVFCQANRMTLQ